MRRPVLVLMLTVAFLVGCSTTPPKSGQRPVPSAPAQISREPQTSLPPPPTPPPSTHKQDEITTQNMTSRLVLYRNDRYGVSLSYPENLNPPEIPQTGFQALKLDLGNGEISVYREEAKPGMTLQDLAQDNIDANTKASSGRLVERDLGKQTLGGEDAWEVQFVFPSAAGRFDAILYFVLKDGFEYLVSCETKQGPPVVPWSAVEPVCQRILATIKFEP